MAEITRPLLIGAVVPAAGLSSRMGRFKPLLPFGESSVIETSVANVLTVAQSAAVVLGKRADELAELMKSRFGKRVTIAFNPDYASTDMLTSVRIGLRALRECDAFFILPADMPAISRETFKAVADAFSESDDIVIPVTNGRRGHPPLISARLIPDILRYEGDGGLRGFYGSRKVREIPISDEGILTDLDTPDDYDKAEKRCNKQL